MSRVADILEAAAVALMVPGAWTQKAIARDDQGISVSAIHPEAVCFCAEGAIEAATFALHREFPTLAQASRGMLSLAFEVPVCMWNDSAGRDAEEVAEQLWLAAERVRDEQGS